MQFTHRFTGIVVSLALGTFFPATFSIAQESSLLRQPVPQYPSSGPTATLQPIPMPHRNFQTAGFPTSGEPRGIAGDPTSQLSNVSWTYQPAPRLRTFQKNDIVTIRVDEITNVTATGAADSRKQTLYEAILTDWLQISDFKIGPARQADGDPTVAAESQGQFRSQSSVKSRESMTFNIAATVVDIRANGTLVLEARKTIRVNDNLWETSLSGLCRAQDIAPDNVILSRDLIDLEIHKEDQGHLRDGYKRGWFSRWFDRVQPF